MPTPEAIIDSLYRAILGREPDPSGHAVYVEELRKGISLDHIVSVFIQSDEFMRKIHSQFSDLFTEKTNVKFPIDYNPPPTEAGKTYFARRANGFFDRFLSGEKILDIGYKGYDNPREITVVPHAIGVDLDFPGYDGFRLPFADGSIDTVFSSHCLEHIELYQPVIRDWYRVLKVGGFLLCVVPSQLLYEKKKDLPSRFNRDHKRFYTPSRLIEEFRESLVDNSYRIRLLEENDSGYDYTRGPETHPVGCYEIVLAMEKINRPCWDLTD
jgi:predicted SAM-dependent methyltransferase